VVPCENAGEEANSIRAAASSKTVARILLDSFEFIPSPEATHLRMFSQDVAPAKQKH
jgi:hypothetical protein